MGKRRVLFIYFIFYFLFSNAQVITNPDLNGVIPALPTGWQRVPTTDPVSLSSNAGVTDTPDLTDVAGPNPVAGIIGIPHSGLTFISALRGKYPGAPYTPPNAEFHEGIMQTVNGFNPGQTYTINFYQAVVKQERFLDPSGSWAVYFGNTLAGVSAPSYSPLVFNDINLIWQKRSVNFTATASTHLLKFLVEDDDPNIMSSLTDTTGGLRMGIDSIWITTCNFSVNLGPDISICPPNNTINLNATTPNATYLWQNNSTASTLSANASGTYWVTVTANGCSVTDSIHIFVGTNSSATQNQSICAGGSYVLPGGAIVTLPGIYIDTIQNTSGCDSIITTNITAINALTTNQNISICSGNTYALPGGTIANSSGIYIDTLNSFNGCDSIITTTLSIKPNVTSTVSPIICSGNFYTLPGGTQVSTSGTYIDTLLSFAGCDSIITTNLSTVSAILTNQNLVLCVGNNYTLPGGTIVTAAGTYIDTLTAFAGCDSIITTNLTFTPNVTSAQSASFCVGGNFTLPGGTIVTTPGIYYDTLTSAFGCDSIITSTIAVHSLQATATSPDLTILIGESTSITASGGGNYSWSPSTGLNTTNAATVIASPAQTTTYCVVVTSPNGCIDSTCVTIYVESPCALNENKGVPNAFSPNGDNTNEEFCLQGWDACIENFSINIFDRWGEKVFESKDPNFCWDGKFRNNVMDAQVFVYSIKAEYIGLDKPIVIKGNISLIR